MPEVSGRAEVAPGGARGLSASYAPPMLPFPESTTEYVPTRFWRAMERSIGPTGPRAPRGTPRDPRPSVGTTLQMGSSARGTTHAPRARWPPDTIGPDG